LRKKWTILASIVPVVLIADLLTKRWALAALADGARMDLFGGLVPLTLAFNRGAAFGLSIGDDPRWIFIPITVVALILLASLFRQADGGDHLRIVSIALVTAGATGNLIDRVRWDRGVVDFIGPINLGFMDWPIFNVADMAITCGALLLALSFALEERNLRRAGTASPTQAPDTQAGTGTEPMAEGNHG
jgi:signal peptidase II